MSKKQTVKPIAVVMGTAFAASMAMSNVASAATTSNPFAMHELSSGYTQLADNTEGNCGNKAKPKNMEGNCGNKKEMQKNMEGNCGNKKTVKEGKCGEGKCGSNKKKAKPMNEGKCGGNK